jgi:hypothetical protein
MLVLPTTKQPLLVFSPTSKLSESLRAYVGVFTNMKSTEPLLVFSPTRKL